MAASQPPARLERAVKETDDPLHHAILLDQIKDVRDTVSVLAKSHAKTAQAVERLEGAQSTMVDLLRSIDQNIGLRTDWERIDREAKAKADAEASAQLAVINAQTAANEAKARAERARWMRKSVESTVEWLKDNWKVVIFLMLLLPGNLDAAARLGILPEPLAVLIANTVRETGVPVQTVETVPSPVPAPAHAE